MSLTYVFDLASPFAYELLQFKTLLVRTHQIQIKKLRCSVKKRMRDSNVAKSQFPQYGNLYQHEHHHHQNGIIINITTNRCLLIDVDIHINSYYLFRCFK